MSAADLYLDRSTALHGLDPRAKLAGVLALFLACLAFTHPAYVAVVAGSVLLLSWWARALSNLWRMRVLLALLLAFGGLLWSVFGRGRTPLFPGWPLIVTRESVLYGLGTGLRLTTMAGAGLLFLSVTRVEEFAAALQRLGVPFVVTFAFTMAFRLVPMLLASAATVVEAQRSRGLDLESGSFLARLLRHLPLLVPVMVSAIRNSDLMAMALESRGFRAGLRRTSLLWLHMRAGDWLALLVSVALIGASVWLRVTGHGLVSGVL
jgi:energy-coupling factor transport system permease protein